MMAFWLEKRHPDPVPPEAEVPGDALEAMHSWKAMRRERDVASAERDTALEQLESTKRRCEALVLANKQLREQSVDKIALDMKRQSDQDRRNAVDLADEVSRLRDENEALRRQLNREPVTT